MTKEKKKKMSVKDKIIVSLWWFGAIFSLLLMLGGLVQIYRGMVESDSIGLIVSLLMTLLFYWIYSECVKGIEHRTGNKMGHKVIIYIGGFFLGIMLLGVIIGFFSAMIEPSFEEEQEKLYNNNIQSINNKEVPKSNEDTLYKDSSEIEITEDSSYEDRIKALQLYAYGEELSCTYPEEQVGSTCCVRSIEVPDMCENEYQTLLTRYENVEDITYEGQTYNLNGKTIEIPWGYFMLEDVSFAGDNIDVMLSSSDELGNYYEIRIMDRGYMTDFNHKELSHYMYNTIAEYFNSTISEITFYKNGESKISYFDYYIVDNYEEVTYNRYSLLEKDNQYLVVIYIGSNEEYINEVNLITDSLN